jgi:heme oxygenase
VIPQGAEPQKRWFAEPVTVKSLKGRAVHLAPLMRQLKNETAFLHAQVESALGLLDPALTAQELVEAVAGLYGFWAGTEPLVARWLAQNPARSRAVHGDRRQRRQLLAHDLRSLGMPPTAVAVAPSVFTVVGAAEVFGWLYVVEGSTLGGAIIHRQLRRLPRFETVSLRGLSPYPEGPGPMWQSFVDGLQQWAGCDPDRSDAVVAAAVATFDGLRQWLAHRVVGASP